MATSLASPEGAEAGPAAGLGPEALCWQEARQPPSMSRVWSPPREDSGDPEGMAGRGKQPQPACRRWGCGGREEGGNGTGLGRAQVWPPASLLAAETGAGGATGICGDRSKQAGPLLEARVAGSHPEPTGAQPRLKMQQSQPEGQPAASPAGQRWRALEQGGPETRASPLPGQAESGLQLCPGTSISAPQGPANVALLQNPRCRQHAF